MVKAPSQYSKYCILRKYKPRRTVKARLNTAWKKRLAIREWWAQVTVTPLERRITVLRRGIE